MAGTDFENISEAGEYVLGTLDTAERIAFEARLMRDAFLQAEVDAWRRRLAPLDSETAETEPPAEVFEKILSRIETPVPLNVIHLQRRVTIWRNAAVAITAIAAALLIFVLTGPRERTLQKGVYVAVLQGEDRTTGFVAAVDIKAGIIAVRSVTAPPQQAHSYELWALGAGRPSPQPMGVISASTKLPAYTIGTEALTDTTLAVSLEPVGGSTTGFPTGPVLFTGKLLAVN